MKLPTEEMEVLLKGILFILFLFAISLLLGIFTYKSFKKKKKKGILITSSLIFVALTTFILILCTL